MSILQEWVEKLGLRYQGVLVSAIRGCDTASKQDPSKGLVRSYRAEVLRAHAGDPRKSKSFIEKVDDRAVAERMSAFVNNWDHYPLHYVVHLIHAAQIVGYYHPDCDTQALWHVFYKNACNKLHMSYESKEALAFRLEAPEDSFFAQQDSAIKVEEAKVAVERVQAKLMPTVLTCRHCNRFCCVGACLGT